MSQFNAKFKLIFLPFLFITSATVGLYTFLHWLLFIKMDLVPVDEEILNLFVPMFLPWGPILIWIRPRIKLLNLKNTKGKDPLMGYMLLVWVAMAAPLVIGQAYMVTATGALTPLTRISEINTLPKTKFYSVRKYYIDKSLTRVKTTFTVSGKYNENFDIAIYAPCQIFDQNYSVPPPPLRIVPPSSDTSKPLILLNGKITTNDIAKRLVPNQIASVNVIKGQPATALYGNAARHGIIIITTKIGEAMRARQPAPDSNASIIPAAWIALKFQKTISNKLSRDEKQVRYKAFLKESQAEFDSAQLNNFVYLDRIGPSKDLKNYTAAVNSKDSSNMNKPVIILSPVNEAFSTRNGKKLPWIFGSLAIGSIIFMIALLFKPLKDDDLEANPVKEENVEKKSVMDEFKQLFSPREGFYITPIIVDINLVVFIAMCLAGLGFVSFDAPDLLKWGANYRPFIINGQYWRLLTNMFLHGGLMHILFNMCGLLFVGLFLEPLLGKGKYAAAYLGSGIIASIASAWWHPATVSVGASGAIFGMYGIFLALLTTNLYPASFKKSFLISTSIFVGYNLLFGLTGGIDNAAHIGGLASGLLIGYALYPSLKKRADQIAGEEGDEAQIPDEPDEKAG